MSSLGYYLRGGLFASKKMFMSKKNSVIFMLSTVIIIFCWYFFVYSSVDNQIMRLQGKEINSWYFNSKSIEDKGLGEPRPVDEKRWMVNQTKATLGLNDDWSFARQNFETKKVDQYSQIIDIITFFENKNTKELSFFKERYYYGLDTIQPIPLSDHNWNVTADGNVHEIATKTLGN